MKTKEMTMAEIREALGYDFKIVVEASDKAVCEGCSPIKILADVTAGKTVKLGAKKFIVLEQFGNTTALLLKDFWKKTPFDSDGNNWSASDIRNELNTDFYSELVKILGEDNIVEHEVNLTSDDGRKDYGSVTDNISMLTCEQYRKYVNILDKYRQEGCWWLVTPYSTLPNGDSTFVLCVYNNGSLNNHDCSRNNGVRPFCIVKSNIFVSE